MTARPDRATASTRAWNGLVRELRAIGIATAFFAAWIAGLILIKTLVLAEYRIAFDGWTKILVGALILSKVVLVLEKVPLGDWVDRRPAWCDIVLRTAVYGVGVALVLLLEKVIEASHEASGLGPALRAVLAHESGAHVMANAVGVSGALLAYNLVAVVRCNLGDGALVRMLASPMPPRRASRDGPDDVDAPAPN